MRREEEINNASYAYWINNYANIEFIDEEEKELHTQDIQESFINGAEWADEHPHWISVEDELPPKDKAYLAYWQHLGVTKYRYVKAGAKVSRTFSEHITHWMPLPPTEGIKGNQGETSPNQEGGEE